MTQPYSLHVGNCLDVLKTLDAESIDAIVTDPPYGLAFMGKKWDYDVPPTDIWQECLRVLKPGGHLLAFAGTRTQHRMACRIEDAGFEIRDMIAWVYGSGFPKSHDVSKAIDRMAGAEQEVVGTYTDPDGITRTKRSDGIWSSEGSGARYITTPATEAAKQWQGWGTALKPALEPITMARKPLIGTVAENVLTHGTGAINVDGCRVGTEKRVAAFSSLAPCHGNKLGSAGSAKLRRGTQGEPKTYVGRWPANLIHDGSDEVVGLFPETLSSKRKPCHEKGRTHGSCYSSPSGEQYASTHGDSGSAARFFYCAKASKAERDEGCEGLEQKRGGSLNMRTDAHSQANDMDTGPRRNHHPTVKPTDLMRYLCRLVNPPSGTVLDPFMGSGSTGVAALREGFKFIGVELNPEYVEIARNRIENELNKAPLFANA